MKALIHIGIEKTGTTTIQEFLHLNRDKLAKQGVGYLRSPGLRNNRKLATYCMDNHKIDDQVKYLRIFSDAKRNEWKAKFRQEFDREIKNLDHKISSVIISSEHFHSRLTIKDEIKNLLDILKPYFTDIKILVYLRRQDQVAVSHYSTKIKVGKTKSAVLLPQGVSPNDPYYNYYDLIERWASVFGKQNIDIRIFDKSKFIEGDLLQDFINAVGLIKADKFVIPERKNEKLSASVQHGLMLMNECFPESINNIPVKFNNQLRNYLISQLQQKYQGKEKLPTRKEALDFYGKFSDSNKRLADKYLSSESIFSNDFSMYPEESKEENLNEEIVQDIFCLIAKFLSSSFIVPKNRVESINPNKKPEVALRDIALLYELDYPEISLFLMKEARKYRPNHPSITEQIEKLNNTILK
ncbi:MAG: hypothetical protein QNJ60_03375 [Xenococcaceae cyanobacterium MO_188.B19]|nr:hypothetical protein [Xenococcaceae cyanobacterium MO_188.B19]